jgi:mannose-6-phosphate isomerase
MPDLLAEPLVVTPDLRGRPWAGTRLGASGGGIGEAWLAWGGCRVAGGASEGRTLDEVAAAAGEAFLGTAGTRLGRGRFPLLAKLIDTAEWLSVQVHPDDAQALELEGEPGIGKRESWLVLDAGPRAELRIGRDPSATPDAIRAAIGTDALPELLQRIRPRVGDRIDVPAGTLHALGPDLLVYELQQPSDITYRAWDWGRMGREIHLAQTRRVLDADAVGVVEAPVGDALEAVVAASPFYRAVQLQIPSAARRSHATDGTGPHAVTVLEGAVELTADGRTVALERWGTAVLAASAGSYTVTAAAGGTARLVIASAP